MRRAPTLLCAANFPPSVGYAWDFIHELYDGVAQRLAPRGVRTVVAYPTLAPGERAMLSRAATAIALDTSFASPRSVAHTARLVRRENIRTVYLTDRPGWHPAYAALRAAGVRRIVLHDHTSGVRDAAHGVRRAAKWALARSPLAVDRVVTVSDYVARRHTETLVVPPARVTRIWNFVPKAARVEAKPDAAPVIPLPPGRPIVACISRATPEKGVAHLMRAFDNMLAAWPAHERRPVLVHAGHGPAWDDLQVLRGRLRAGNDVLLAGYVAGASQLLAHADVCVVPSVWDEAFCLVALEAMAKGVPLIASRAGAIPEFVEHGVTGLLIAPGDEHGLASAMRDLLRNPARARALGVTARAHVDTHFRPERQIDALANVLADGLVT